MIKDMGKRNYYYNILDSLDTGVVVIDLKGNITTFNRAAEKITGFISEKTIGKRFDVVFGLNFFQNPQLNFNSIKNIQENTLIEGNIHRKGKSLLYLSLSISPVQNSQGEKVGIVLLLQNITKMKKLEEQASRTDRLSAMGEMAAKIAHEIRNPLGSIELFNTTLIKDLEGFEGLKTLAENISSGVETINNIISNLLMFIRPQEKPDFKNINIHDMLNDSLFFSKHLLQSNGGVEVVTAFSAEPLMVYGDFELLKQVTLNLILNAIQAMSQEGKLTISTREVNGRPRGSNIAEIRFVDTGIGINRTDMTKIFDPFFTTKKNGTGLGMTIVHNIIKIHGGAIYINSSEHEGTECVIGLPLYLESG